MKKVFVILGIIIIFLSGCSGKPAPVKKEFKAKVISKYNGINIKAEISSSNHSLVIEMKEPNALKGYVYKYNDSELSITYNELKIDSGKDYLPDNSFASVLYSVTEVINRDEINYVGKYGTKAKYSGKCESGDFEIQCDYNSGYISDIELKQIEFKANLKTK